MQEIITLFNLPAALIPPDTPTFLTDLTWERILTNLEGELGVSMTKTLSDIGCEPNVRYKVLRWIYKDTQRKTRYLKALEVQSETLEQHILDISDGDYKGRLLVPRDPKELKRFVRKLQRMIDQNLYLQNKG